MNENYYAVIMAGGGGTRLWPLSRRARPKQALKLLGDRSMFQLAVDRLAPLFPPERILVVTVAEQAGELMRQSPSIPRDNFVLEPMPKGTASVIGLAATVLRRRGPGTRMACLTADHYIGNEARFREALAAAGEVANQGYLVTLGITPSYPSTGYGYIERGEGLGAFRDFEAYRVVKFKEKPSLELAEQFTRDGRHSWNSGMFIWTVDRVLQEFERQMPSLYSTLQDIDRAIGTRDETEVVERKWAGLRSETIDYGIMEGARDVAVIPADGLEWSDVGSWETLLSLLDGDESGNVVIAGTHVHIDSTGTLIHSEHEHRRLVATIGVSDLVIVDTEDILLVCPKDRSQDVRALVEKLKRRPGGDEYL